MPATTQLPLLVILGPTAVGKTELSLTLGERYKGEILGADSRQIYRGMDIGTAKPTAEEQQRLPHHLIDLRQPDETLSVAEYQQLAYTTIDAVHNRGHLPCLVGGTALYIRAVTEGLRFPEVPPNPALRAELEAELAASGPDPLFARLQQLDPATAARIDARNGRRLVRALEIVISTGRSKVELEGSDPPPYRILMLGFMRERTELYERIDQRVDWMIENGLIKETERLLAAGYAPTLPAMTSLGYREITAYLQGQLSLPEAINQLKFETHRYVRYQMTAFRKLANVHWHELSPSALHVLTERVERFLQA
jgi:tRNA dimethylallyltransferase